MTCNPRPTEIVCACGNTRRVSYTGTIPDKCRKCQQREYLRTHRRRLKEAPETVRHRGDLGPERPQYGMTEDELREYKRKRVVELYTTEGLNTVLIAERLGWDKSTVCAVLQAAGIEIDGRSHLAAGVPS